MARQILTPEKVHKPTTFYSHAAVIHDVVYSAGQAPHDEAGVVWPMSDIPGQVRQALENLKVVLHAGGAEFSDIAKMTLFARTSEVIPIFWEIIKDYLTDNQPAITVSVVSGLAGSQYMLEVEAIAVKK